MQSPVRLFPQSIVLPQSVPSAKSDSMQKIKSPLKQTHNSETTQSKTCKSPTKKQKEKKITLLKYLQDQSIVISPTVLAVFFWKKSLNFQKLGLMSEFLEIDHQDFYVKYIELVGGRKFQ